MKIFANNFALILSVRPKHKHFRFETHALSDVADEICAGKLLFPGQVWYVKAKKEKDLGSRLKELQCDSKVTKKYAQIVVIFKSDKKRKAFLEAYMEKFTPIVAAGGLVVNHKDELLLIYRHDLWDLPKGKLEKDESISDAAWREVAEETGARHHNVGKKAAVTYHVFLGQSGKWRFKTTHWYHMTTKKEEKIAPQVKEGISKVAWKPLKKLAKKIPVTYPQIMEMMQLAVTAAGNPSTKEKVKA